MTAEWTLVDITDADGPDTADRLVAAHRAQPWPAGLREASWFTSLDGEVVAELRRFTTEAALRAAAGPASFAFRLHESSGVDGGEPAGCVNIVIRENADHESAARFIAALVERSAANPQIGSPTVASFHIGVDDAVTLLYSEWPSKQAHDDHMAGMRHTMADLYRGLPAPVSFHQYRHHLSLRTTGVPG